MIADSATPSTKACRYAVALGCTTASRLAREWSISNGDAAIWLRRAEMTGAIHRIERGVYGVSMASLYIEKEAI